MGNGGRRLLEDLLAREGPAAIECPRCGHPSPGRGGIVVVFPSDHPDGDEAQPIPRCRRCGEVVSPEGRALAIRRLIVDGPGWLDELDSE